MNGAIVGELFGAFEGLGYMMLDSRYVGNTVRVFLAAVFCALIGWLLGRALGAKWLKIIFVMWQRQAPYDDQYHLASMTRHQLRQPQKQIA